MREQPIAVPSTSITVAPGASGVIASVDSGRTRGYKVFLSRLGIAIDPVSNRNFATFRLRVNGTPIYPFQNITSQVGDISNPTTFDDIPLGDSVSVDVFGEMAAGAVGNTEMAATFHLKLKPVE